MDVRAPLPNLAAGERRLDADTSRYLCRVLRLSEGDRFVAFDPAASLEADAVILEASADAARARIEEPRAARVVARAPLALVYALAKGDKVDAVVRDATELGATRVVIARTARAVAKVDHEREAAKLARWRRVAEQAARQCGRSDPAEVLGVFGWEDALDRASGAARFCLDPSAADALGARLPSAVSRGEPITFAVGPEGGLTPEEVRVATARGYVAVSLGPFVLRTETVAAAVLGAVRVLSAR